MKARILPVFLVALLLLSACGPHGQSAKSTPNGAATQPATASSGSNAATPTPASPRQSATATPRPQKSGSCLGDFPVYPGAKKLSSDVLRKAPKVGKGGQLPSAGYVTGDSPEKVAKFYQTHAPRGGWTKGLGGIGHVSNFFVWNRGSQNMQVLIFKDDDGSVSGETKGKTVVLVVCGVRSNVSRFPTYTIQNGLPNDSVKAILVAPDGTMWFATSGGLAKFDGKKWQVYTTKQGLPSKRTSAVALAPDGSIWVGTQFRGVAHFDGKKWKTYRKSDGLISDSISSIAVANDGTVWVGSCYVGGGASRFDGKKWTSFDKSVLPGAGCVKAVLVARDGTVWAGTSRGLFRFDGKKWIDSKLAHGQVLSLAEDPSGGLWIGMFTGAVYFDGKSSKKYTAKDGLADGAVLSIAVAPDGAVWFGTLKGASRLKGGQWKTYTKQTGLPSEHITSVAVTADGKVLLGTSLRGVVVLGPAD